MRLADMLSRFAAHWKLKASLSASLTLFFCVSYFTLQHVGLFPVRVFASSPIDNAVGFDPRWVWTYQSAYVLLAVVPWAADVRDDLARYARGFVLLSCVGFTCFALFPVAGPRPAVSPTGGMFGWLVSYDQPTNAFPSLHVALAAYTVLFGARVSSGRLRAAARGPLLALGAAWVAAIAYAALATKQHYAIDLPAGLLLALVSHRWARRAAGETTGARARSAPRGTEGVGL